MAANKSLLKDAFVLNMNGNVIEINQVFSNEKVAISILEKVAQSVNPEEAKVLNEAIEILYKQERQS